MLLSNMKVMQYHVHIGLFFKSDINAYIGRKSFLTDSIE